VKCKEKHAALAVIIIEAMNDPGSVSRLLGWPVAKSLNKAPVVVITGSRQTGKNTLIRQPNVSTNRTYLTLDDPLVQARAENEPDVLVRTAGRLAVGQMQRSSELLFAIRRAVDERQEPGRYILTGSSVHRAAEILGDRAAYFSMYPMTRREQLGLGQAGAWQQLLETPERDWFDLLENQTAQNQNWENMARSGGYPSAALDFQDREARSLWFGGYIQAYLERDLQGHTAPSSRIDLQRLLRAMCRRLGDLINQAQIGRDVELSKQTIRRYLDVLEASYQLVRVPAYCMNRTKRLVKTAKMYWTDTGLAMYLAGETKPRKVHLANLILCDLLTWQGSVFEEPEIFYWRTSTGEEVDFVIQWQGQLLPIFVTTSGQPKLCDTHSLRAFRTEYPDVTRAGLLLHTGEDIEWLADGILAAPWWCLI